MATEKTRLFHCTKTSMRAFVNEYRPGSGAIASQLDADIVSVTLFPLGKVALAAPAQQSSRIRTSESDRSRSVCIADHLVKILLVPGCFWGCGGQWTYCNHGESVLRVLQAC